MKKRYFISAKLALMFGVLLFLSACQEDAQNTPAPAGAAAPPPPAVTTAAVLEEEVEVWKI